MSVRTERRRLAAAERNVREQRLGIPPTSVDGRNIDPRLGRLMGEASIMKVARPERGFPLHQKLGEMPIRPDLAAQTRTYYDLAMLKRPVWRWYIPAYFYLGGAAGACGAVGAACQLSHRRSLQGLVARTHWMAAVGLGASALFLIADLGKPWRFFNMMRVVRPSSPMNVGTWIIAAAGASSVTAALGWGHRGPVGWLGRPAGYVAGYMGLPLSTYTAVLTSNTAVPLWQEGRHTLPFLFAASALTSGTALLTLMGSRGPRRIVAGVAKLPVVGWFATANARGFMNRTPLAARPTPRENRILARLGEIGRVAELVAGFAYEREVARLDPSVGEPLRHGKTGLLWRGSMALALAGIVLGRLGRRSRSAQLAGAVAATLGSVAMRFAVLEGGKVSARNPRASFVPQRRRMASERGRPMPPAELPAGGRPEAPAFVAGPGAP